MMSDILSLSKKKLSLEALLPAVSRETLDDLVVFEQLALKWQSHINLVSPSTIPSLWHRHILDSVQPFLLQKDANLWLDLGSGGGFPGLVTAVLLKHRGGGFVNLVESNNKKAAFLRLVIAELKLPAQVYPVRIENLYNVLPKPDIITARALASLDKLFELISFWLNEKTIALLQKGRDYQREIKEAYANWQFNLIEHLSTIADSSIILEVKQLHHKNDKGEQI